MSERCETCAYWRKFRERSHGRVRIGNGTCQRYAPRHQYFPCLGDNPFPVTGSPWPWTRDVDWCGEYRPRQPAAVGEED